MAEVAVPEGAKPIVVFWDQKTQQVGVSFKTEDFMTWDFALAVLEMAKGTVTMLQDQAKMMAMQQQMANAQQGMALANNVSKKILRH